jgi:16S rRNA processing protein RimM
MESCTFLTIGKITGVHGLAGNLKVWSYAESAGTFAEGRRIMLRDEGAENGKMYTITKSGVRKKGILMGLDEVITREESEALVGKEILMDKTQLPDLEEDTWYWEDLIGLSVIDREKGELGIVDRLFATGADDILVVVNSDKMETLIPMNKHFVDEVDLDAGRINAVLPEGFVTE